MNFTSNGPLILTVSFLVFLVFFFMPLMPAAFAFYSSGEGVCIEGSPPMGSVYADRSGTVMPDGEFLWPLTGILKRGWGFGWRFHPIRGRWAMHNGIDIGATEGTKIIAVEDGVVVFSGSKGGYGNTVIIDHGGGIKSLYAHCSKLLVRTNQQVSRGHSIAEVGSTGLSTGPHLHFEIRVDNKAVDPLPYVSSGDGGKYRELYDYK